MKSLTHFRLLASAALVACATVSLSAKSNIIDFDTYPTGTLDTGANSPWSKSGQSIATVEELAGGGKALQLSATASSSIILDTAGQGMSAIIAPQDQPINWNFEFLMPEDAGAQTTYLRLNTGSAGVGKYIGGVALIDGKFAYLRNPNSSNSKNSFTVPSGVTLSHSTWYTVSMEISFGGESNDLSYVVTLLDSTSGNSLFSQTISMSPNALSEDALRMTISLDGTSDLQLRNVSLTAVPEPGATAAIVGAGLLLLLGVSRGKRALRRS